MSIWSSDVVCTVSKMSNRKNVSITARAIQSKSDTVLHVWWHCRCLATSLFLLILNVLGWNKSHYLYAGWCVISFHVFYIMFLLVKNKTKNSSGGFKTTALIHVTMHYSKQLKTENIGMLSIFHILNQYNSGFYKPQR